MRVPSDTTSGQFEFAPQDVTTPDEIGTSITALLLEHARLMDERENAEVGACLECHRESNK